MQLFNFNIIKLTLCLIIGIIIGSFLDISLNASIYLTLPLLILLFIIFLISKKQFKKTIWFGVVGFTSMISIGVLTTNFHNQKNFASHYTHVVSKSTDSLNAITFRIREVLKSGNYYDKYVIDLIGIDNKKVSGKSLLNIEKDTLTPPLKVDELYITKTAFKDLITPLNPYQFNYKEYLEKKYIYHQVFTSNSTMLKISTSTKTLLGVADNIRQHINKKLRSYNFKPAELAIINALLLGQRQDISEEVYTSYTNAGAIHILAVSGLHVGVVLFILSLIFKPLDRFKHGKLIKTIVLVSFLWSFALIAGLSASVTRAVTMFSIVAVALNLKRPTNIYNTLAISMLVILLFKPLFLFDVGFQLSYLAVFAIVSIDPSLYKLWTPKNKILDLYWHTFTITVSAQFGIIPLSLYYFHQFPSLFFISNLVIIPFLGIILGLGILVIILAACNILPQFVANLYGGIIDIMNGFVSWISHQEAFLFRDIPFSLLYVLVSYIFIITLINFLIQKTYNSFRFLLIIVLVIQATFLFKKINTPDNEFVIFHKSRHSLIANTTLNKLYTAHNFDSLTRSKNRIIKDYSIGNHISGIEESSIKPIYQLRKERLIVVDSLGIYQALSFQPDYVLLIQSPKINLNRLIDSIKPKYIIADGSNYKSYIERWDEICEKRKIPFHQTSKKGAFVIKY